MSRPCLEGAELHSWSRVKKENSGEWGMVARKLLFAV